MTIASLIPIVLQLSIVGVVFAMGLGTSLADVLAVRHRPGELVRSLLAMDIIMPAVAVALTLALDLPPAVKIALVALALSPIPPLLPRRQTKAGGSSSHAMGLLVVAGLFAIVFIPVALEVIERMFSLPLSLSPLAVAKVVGISILLPLAGGIAFAAVAPGFAARMARPISLAAMAVLVIGLVPVLVTRWSQMMSLIGDGTLLAMGLFVLVGLAAGHFLGGPGPGGRTVLSFAASTRHPGVALAIAKASFPDEKLALPAILLYGLVATVIGVPYARWRARADKTTDALAP